MIIQAAMEEVMKNILPEGAAMKYIPREEAAVMAVDMMMEAILRAVILQEDMEALTLDRCMAV